MSKPSDTLYVSRPEDDGSDMDVSSDDEGLHAYQQRQNQAQQGQQLHGSQEQRSFSTAVFGSESGSSRLITNTNCWTTFVSKVAQHQAPIVLRDGASDTDSTSSFHTAPSSPIDLTLDDGQDMDIDRHPLPDIVNELVSEQSRLTQELERHSNEEKRIARLIMEKRAKLEAIRVQQLELQVRKSIQKNRKAVITPTKSKKGKEKATIDGQYRSCSDSDEEDTRQQPPRKAKAIMNAESGRPERQLVEEPVRVKPNGEAAKDKEAQVEAKKSGTKKTDEPQTQHAAAPKKREKAMPYIMDLAKQNKHTLQAIRRGQQLGNTSVGQMKMFLCDLYDKFKEDGTLSRIQKVHYKELVRQVSKYNELGDDHIPGKVAPKKAKKQQKKLQPEKRRMLPSEFYGHPKRLNFKNYKVDNRKLMDALTCSDIEVPPILVKVRNLFSKHSVQLTLSDFEGVIGPTGELVDREELMMYMGNQKIKRVFALYREVAVRTARTTPMTMGERTRHEYYVAQRRLEESVQRQNGTASPEPSSVENPLVSDNSTAALNSVRVSQAPSSREVDARPITTITYIPNENSFIRSILPGGREPAKTTKPLPSKSKAVQQPKPLPQSKPSNPPVSLPPPPAAAPVKSVTPTPAPAAASAAAPAPAASAPAAASAAASAAAAAAAPAPAPAPAQIPTIPKNSPASKSSDKPSVSAPNTPSPSSTHPQPSAAPTPPPPQNKSLTFQPYRSALDSLGVTRSVDVRQKKTGILCRAESNGGVCNDKSCQDMHFADFTHT